jgi:hypothetical protein
MQAKIEVADRREAALIRAGLSDPETRALVKVIGALLPLSKSAQRRALRFVADHFAEMREPMPDAEHLPLDEPRI